MLYSLHFLSNSTKRFLSINSTYSGVTVLEYSVNPAISANNIVKLSIFSLNVLALFYDWLARNWFNIYESLIMINKIHVMEVNILGDWIICRWIILGLVIKRIPIFLIRIVICKIKSQISCKQINDRVVYNNLILGLTRRLTLHKWWLDR